MFKKWLVFLLLLLLFVPCALGQESLPEGIHAALAPDLSLLSDGTVESFCFPSQEECIVLLRDGKDELTLYAFTLTDGAWRRNWGNRHFSLVTEHPVSLCVHEGAVYAPRTGAMLPPGFAITEIDDVSAAPLQTFDFTRVDGEWRLIGHTTSDGISSEVLRTTVRNSRPVFWADERWTDLTGKIAFPHDGSSSAQSMAISMLPSVYEGMVFFDLTPRFSMPETGLISVCIGRNGLKYPVYTGPGSRYHRAAEGRACVSSSESFGVLGKSGEWLMVIYGISGGRVRVGYVRYIGDAYLEQIAAFTHESDFSHIENVFTTKRIPLWDDPINRKNPLCTLAKNTEVIYLEDCGDLAYVEVIVGSKRMRGFVKADSLGNG